jgi:CRP-like cAMP-binding protein
MATTTFSNDLFEKLNDIATPARERQGAVLFRAGDQARGAFIIRKGQVRLSLGENPSLYPSRILGPGHVIGLPATFSGEPYSLTAEVAEDCELDFIPQNRFLELLKSQPTIGCQVVRVLSEEIYDMRHAKNETSVVPQDWTAQ